MAQRKVKVIFIMHKQCGTELMFANGYVVDSERGVAVKPMVMNCTCVNIQLWSL